MHRYVAIARRDAIQPAFDVLLAVVNDVFPVDRATVEDAKAIVLARHQLSARDALHVAVMARHGIGRILSFDAGFDGVPNVDRISA